MPQITSNFIFRSKSPNFERDSFKTWQEMVDVPSSYIDEGHISFCEERGLHYIFKSFDTTDGGVINYKKGD